MGCLGAAGRWWSLGGDGRAWAGVGGRGRAWAGLTEPWQWPGGAWTGLWVATALLDVGGVWLAVGGRGQG